jgi:hypothetical protein
MIPRSKQLQRTSFLAFFDVTIGEYYVGTGEWERNTYTDSQTVFAPRVYGIDGTVFTDDNFNNTAVLPPGVYQINFVAWKNFGDNNHVDTITTPPFQLIYTSPLSSQSLAGCLGKHYLRF